MRGVPTEQVDPYIQGGNQPGRNQPGRSQPLSPRTTHVPTVSSVEEQSRYTMRGIPEGDRGGGFMDKGVVRRR